MYIVLAFTVIIDKQTYLVHGNLKAFLDFHTYLKNPPQLKIKCIYINN